MFDGSPSTPAAISHPRYLLDLNKVGNGTSGNSGGWKFSMWDQGDATRMWLSLSSLVTCEGTDISSGPGVLPLTFLLSSV